MRKLDLTGQTIGKVTLLSPARTEKKGVIWNCKCDCGNLFEALGWRIRNGHTVSCGCFRKSGEPGWKGYGEIGGTYWSSIRNGATDRGLVMEITIEQAWDIFIQQKRRCALSGLPLRFCSTRARYAEQTASLDRIDSSQGYTLHNVQWVYKELNAMKMAMTDATFIGWCMTISHHAESTALCGYFTKGLPPSSYSYSRESQPYVPTFLQS